MKRKVVSKLLAVSLAGAMVLGLAACGGDSNEGSSSGASQASNSTTNSSSNTASSSTTETSASTEPEKKTYSFNKMTIYLPGNNTNTYGSGNPAFDRLVDDINERIFGDSGTKLEFTFTVEADNKDTGESGYYTIVTQDLTTPANLADVVRFSGLPSSNAAFIDAATKSDIFWDLAPYIEEKDASGNYVYPNLAAWTDVHKAALNYYGQIFGLPLARTNTAREGWGYRLDWYNNLNLKGDPTTLEGFEEMLEAFTTGDPDGDGIDNTVGLYLDGWTGALDIMQLWFGVPNQWGLDASGNLVPAHMTEEYKEAVTKFREWYQAGYINQDFLEIGGGQAINSTDVGLRAQQGGIGIQVLDGLRKVETYFESQGYVEENASQEDEVALFTLAGYVDTGLGAYCRPQNNGMNGYISITKTGNIKTEEQLKDALYALDQLSEGWYYDLFTWGWEGTKDGKDQQATYYINDEGYADKIDGQEEKGEVTAAEAYGAEIGQYSNGFNQVITFNYAPGHEPQVPTAPATNPTQVLEQQLYAEDVQYCVPNAATGCISDTYTELGTDLDAIINDARNSYITDAGYTLANLEAAIQQWLDAGGQNVINEMNESYKAMH